MSMISEFVSGLPSYDEDNFTRYSNAGSSVATKRPSLYVPTTESPSEILIVNDKTNVLLRYVYRKWAKQRCKQRCSLQGCHKKRRKLDGDDESP